jgi:protein-S-isoprenylcysteine O-methyltransferase Ste14
MNSPSNTSVAAPKWAQNLRRLNNWLLFDLGGGPRPLKLATVINIQKGGSLPLLALLIWWYADQTPAATSTAAWLYLGMHGAYGLTWLMKDLLFPDPNWQGRATWGSCVSGAFGLSLYWLAGWLLISGTAQPDYPLPAAVWFGLCVFICLLGCVIMVAADVQKFVTLQLQRGLITTGMFKWVRHPNYLGEMMIYGSLALLAWHWIPLLVLAYYWGFMFSTNMVMKEASMSRYPQWAAYKQRSWWLVPFIF